MSKICQKCKKTNDDKSKYCQNCGNELIDKNIEDENNLITNMGQDSLQDKIDITNFSKNNKQLYYASSTMTTNKSIMSYLNKFTSYKKNINYNSNNQFINKTDFYIYESYIILDNESFTQKIFYDMLSKIKINDHLNFMLNLSVELELKSNDTIYLSIKRLSAEDASYIQNIITKRISYPPEIGQNKLLKVYNATIIEQLETIYELDKITSLKQDISHIHKVTFEEKGKFIIYDDHIKIENQIFVQEFNYNMIKSFHEKHDEYILLLKNSEEIKIQINPENPLDEYYKNMLKNKIKNPPIYETVNSPMIQSKHITNNYQLVNQNNTPQYSDNYNQANYNQNRPLTQKSKAIGLILNMLLVGLGYAYVGKWGEGIVLLVIYVICLLFGWLIVPIIIAIILWVYSLFKTNEMIDKYNAGLPY